MGGKHSIHIYNNSSFEAEVKSEYLFVSGTVSPKQVFSIEDTAKKLLHGKTTIIRINLLQKKGGEIIKTVDFKSSTDKSWIITDSGIKRQLYGKALWVEDPKGKFFAFQVPLAKKVKEDPDTLVLDTSSNASNFPVHRATAEKNKDAGRSQSIQAPRHSVSQTVNQWISTWIPDSLKKDLILLISLCAAAVVFKIVIFDTFFK